MLKKFYFILGILLLSAFPLYSASSGTGIFPFLKINPAARPVGMGDIDCLVTSQAILVNPAVIPWLRSSELSVQHLVYLSDVNYSLINYLKPIDGVSGISASLGYLGVGGLKKTVYDPASIDGYTESGSFDYSDTLVQIAYGRTIARGFSFGSSIKAVQESIDGKSSIGAMVSLSGFYYTRGIPKRRGVKSYFKRDTDDWQLGFGVFNIGPQVKGYNLPSGGYTSLGTWLSPSMFWAGEIINYSDGATELRTGLELSISDMLQLRGGYRHSLADNSLGSFPSVDITGGFGIMFQGFSVDYAWAPYGDLGQTHRLSFTARFGESILPQQAKPKLLNPGK